METIEQERRAALEGALIQPRLDLGALIVTGGDRQAWLNGLVTCDLKDKKPGEGAYGLAVGKTGRILAEMWIAFAADHLAVGVQADRLAMLREHFERHLIMEDAEITEGSRRSWLAIHGPRAEELAADARALGADTAAVDYTGRGASVMVLAPPDHGDAVRDALLARAGSTGALASEAGWEQIRVEWGVPRFGVDFDDQNLPQEASLERIAVSFSKGCYLGQETVFMLEKRGHAKKRLMRLAIEGEAALAPGTEVALPDGAVVGLLTSVAKAPEPGSVRALGYVKYKHAEAGAALVIGGRPAQALGLAAEPKAG